MYQALHRAFLDLLASETGREICRQFTACYPPAVISDMKKIDLVLWQIRDRDLTATVPAGNGWNSRDGHVAPEAEHFELRYGDAGSEPSEAWRPVALVGQPVDPVFPMH